MEKKPQLSVFRSRHRKSTWRGYKEQFQMPHTLGL